MSRFTRRHFLGTAAATAAAGSLASAPARAADGTELIFTPEDGAELSVLRWRHFVQGDADQWAVNTKKFTEQTGVPVKVDHIGWEDVRAKAALAARVGKGPDIIISWYDDPHQFPDKLIEVTELADHLGNKYGGWYDGCRKYGMRDGKWIAFPLGVTGNAVVYRKSMLDAVGYDEFPNNHADFLEACKKLQKNDTPAGFALGHSVGDGNNFAHWLLWSHGGKVVDKEGNVVLDSPETIAALKYAKELCATFVPGILGWNDASNNKAYHDGQLSITANGISIYYSLANSDDDRMQEIGKDTYTTHFPLGASGKPTELQQVSQWMAFKYSKYPQAAQAYMQFMMEAEQYNPWMEASIGYVCQPLKAYEANPVWKQRNAAPYGEASATMIDSGFDGPLGPASAATLADYVVVDMFAAAVSDSKTPEKAASDAADRAKRYYRS